MEKKIIFTPVEPNRNLLWLHYREDHLVLERFGSNGWESIGDTDHVTEEEFIEALKNKADLVGGKVPAEQLPSYVDDVVEFDQTQLPETQILVIVGNSSYKNKTVFVNGSTNSSDRIGSQDKYPNMFVNFGENTSESDWVASLPEEGKIYINTDNNHSYRWSGTWLVDLDKQFSDEIAALNNKTYSILYGSVSDRQDLTTGNPGQAVLRVIYETLASNTIYALMSIRFSNNGVSYTLPIFDVDPSEHSFRIYNDGALQKYQITLSGSTYTFTQVENISNTIFISDNAASNKTTVSNLIVNRTYPCVLSSGSEIMLGTCTKTSNPNVTYCAVNLTNRNRFYNVDNTTGVLTLVNNLNISGALYYDAYQSAGGGKLKPDVYKEMAAAFTANWVVIDYSLLGTTLADDIATKVANASAAILTNNPNSTFPEIYLSKKVDNFVHFTKIRYAYVGAAFFNNFSYNITTKALTNPSQVSVVSPVQYYKDNGGTKTASEFLRDYMGAFTPNYFTISRSLLNTTLNDSNFTGVSNASILILEPSGEDTTPRVFIRGGYNADEVRFQEVSHSSNNYIAVRAIVLTKATKALSAEQTNIIQGGASLPGNWVTVDNSELSTTVSESRATEIRNASAIVLTNYSNQGTLILLRGASTSEYTSFFNVNSVPGVGQVAVGRILLTGTNLSGYSVHNTQNIYNYYTSAGGTKTEAEFKTAFVNLIDNGSSGGGTQVYDLGSKTVPDAGPYDITAFNGTEFGVQLREIVLNTVDGVPLLIKYQIVEERDGTRYNRQIGAIPTHTYDGRLQLLTVDKEKPVILDLQGEQVDEGVYDYSFAVTELTTKTS